MCVEVSLAVDDISIDSISLCSWSGAVAGDTLRHIQPPDLDV